MVSKYAKISYPIGVKVMEVGRVKWEYKRKDLFVIIYKLFTNYRISISYMNVKIWIIHK